MSLTATRWAWSVGGLSMPQKLVLLALAEHHNGENGRCDPSAGRLVRMTGLSERAVRAAIAMLEKGGRLKISRRDGHRSSYELPITAPSSTATPAHCAGVHAMQGRTGCGGAGDSGVHEVQGTPARRAPQNRKEPESNPTTSAKPPGDELWSEGLTILRRLTGKSEPSCRGFLGKLLKEARDDRAAVMAALRDAETRQPVEPDAWLIGAVRARGPNGKGASADLGLTPMPLPEEIRGFILPRVVQGVLDRLEVGEQRFPGLPGTVVALLEAGHAPDALYDAAETIARRGVEKMKSARYLAAIVRDSYPRQAQEGGLRDRTGRIAGIAALSTP